MDSLVPAIRCHGRSTASGLPARWRLAKGLATSSAVLPDFVAAAAASAERWNSYWSGGGMVDLSAGFEADPRAAELERRVVLSLYLQGAQEAGFVFTSESGLIQNSWAGTTTSISFWAVSHHFGPFHTCFSVLSPPRVLCDVLYILSAHSHRMLIGACNPMV